MSLEWPKRFDVPKEGPQPGLHALDDDRSQIVGLD